MYKYKHCSFILFINTISNNLGHWTVIFKINDHIYFLDSFGLHPKKYGIHLKNIFKSEQIKKYHYLTHRIQDNDSTTCGAYSIYFIKNILQCNYSITCFTKKIMQHFNKTN